MILVRASRNRDAINLATCLSNQNREREEKCKKQERTAAAPHRPPPVYPFIRAQSSSSRRILALNASVRKGRDHLRSPEAFKNAKAATTVDPKAHLVHPARVLDSLVRFRVLQGSCFFHIPTSPRLK